MKKTNLSDVTFIILIRLDSIQRLENVIAVIDFLTKNFFANFIVVESCRFNNNILRKLIASKVQYFFVEDKDPVLYKSKIINMFINKVITPIVSLWDADVVCNPRSIIESVSVLRRGDADVSYPYNGICFNTSSIIREGFLKRRKMQFLEKHKGKMTSLHKQQLFGGGVFINYKKFFESGCENENYYGWGDDDFDRYEKYKILGYRIYRVNSELYHLTHPRYNNSNYTSSVNKKISKKELRDTKNSTPDNLLISSAGTVQNFV
jgi:hypothetical protein